MNLDKILLIPYLSKELNLIGYKKLPFKTKTTKRRKYENNTDNDTENESENENEDIKIVFDSKKMICHLVTVCIDLMKQVKTKAFNDCDNDEMNKINFKIVNLEKQLDLTRNEVERKTKELSLEKERNRQLQEEIDKLEKKLFETEAEKKKVIKKCEVSEDILKHNMKKQESNIRELHTLIWKQFNLGDKNYFPENFKVIQTQQPDFSKLWSDVKYSSPATKEAALKKAVCIFQENNNLLMEDNYLLKNLILATLEEVNESIEFICEKMCLINDCDLPLNKKISEIFIGVDELNVQMFRNVINDHLSIIKNAAELFEEASFSVSGNLFVCWSDILKQMEKKVKQFNFDE